jgi:hypothetical protein
MMKELNTKSEASNQWFEDRKGEKGVRSFDRKRQFAARDQEATHCILSLQLMEINYSLSRD